MMLLLVAIIATVVALDLVTKFSFTGILNRGVSWGIGNDWPWLWIVVVVCSLVIVLVSLTIYWRLKRKSWLVTLGLGMFLGGILGNTIDRLITGGAVHDFIDFIIFKNNIADMMIIAGAILVGVKIAFR